MWGRRRRQPLPSAAPDLGTHVELVVVGNPDTPNIARQRALFTETGATLQGYSGTVIGYDRGDPAHSLTAVVPGQPDPTQALAQIGHVADALRMAPTPEFADQPTLDANDAYQSALWNRIAR